MTIDSREKACGVLGISTSASTNEINQAYKKLAMKWHPDKWAGKPEAERKAAEEKFKEIGEAKDYLDKNHGEDSYSHKLDEYKSESKQKITKWISEQKVSDEELGEWKDYEKSIDKIESLKELISYLARFNQWTEKYLKEKNNSASSTSDSYPYSEGGGVTAVIVLIHPIILHQKANLIINHLLVIIVVILCLVPIRVLKLP